ncbi:MAG: hypothetical protein KatS3mg114_1164 [Planctomycetaceae bacterium]|nr:MAG: hypothetical protein KatS3mg114_1164 [Planctomycetaceae bacterium]
MIDFKERSIRTRWPLFMAHRLGVMTQGRRCGVWGGGLQELAILALLLIILTMSIQTAVQTVHSQLAPSEETAIHGCPIRWLQTDRDTQRILLYRRGRGAAVLDRDLQLLAEYPLDPHVCTIASRTVDGIPWWLWATYGGDICWNIGAQCVWIMRFAEPDVAVRALGWTPQGTPWVIWQDGTLLLWPVQLWQTTVELTRQRLQADTTETLFHLSREQVEGQTWIAPEPEHLAPQRHNLGVGVHLARLYGDVALAVITTEGAVGVWDIARQTWRWQAKHHHSHVSCVAWDPKGYRLATGGMDGRLRVWDAIKGLLMWERRVEGIDPQGISWSPDGETLATGGFEGCVHLWCAFTGSALGRLRVSRHSVISLEWSQDQAGIVWGDIEGKYGFLLIP